MPISTGDEGARTKPTMIEPTMAPGMDPIVPNTMIANDGRSRGESSLWTESECHCEYRTTHPRYSSRQESAGKVNPLNVDSATGGRALDYQQPPSSSCQVLSC